MARNKGKTELTPWIDPELLDYKPTERQSAFRRCVRNCVMSGKYFKADWYRASARSESEAFKGHPVTPSEFKKWSQKKSFMVWFFEDFPETEPISEQELQMIEHKWWRGVLDAMDEGEEWAFRAFAKVRFEPYTIAKPKARSHCRRSERVYLAIEAGR